jgi:hypothetical protein
MAVYIKGVTAVYVVTTKNLNDKSTEYSARLINTPGVLLMGRLKIGLITS